MANVNPQLLEDIAKLEKNQKPLVEIGNFLKTLKDPSYNYDQTPLSNPWIKEKTSEGSKSLLDFLKVFNPKDEYGLPQFLDQLILKKNPQVINAIRKSPNKTKGEQLLMNLIFGKNTSTSGFQEGVNYFPQATPEKKQNILQQLIKMLVKPVSAQHPGGVEEKTTYHGLRGPIYSYEPNINRLSIENISNFLNEGSSYSANGQDSIKNIRELGVEGDYRTFHPPTPITGENRTPFGTVFKTIMQAFPEKMGAELQSFRYPQSGPVLNPYDYPDLWDIHSSVASHQWKIDSVREALSNLEGQLQHVESIGSPYTERIGPNTIAQYNISHLQQRIQEERKKLEEATRKRSSANARLAQELERLGILNR